jgi:hypothetical protein
MIQFPYETPVLTVMGTTPVRAAGVFKNLIMKNEITEETWIDKQEILMRLHISNRTLQNWRSKGILPFARIGKKIYYKESDIRKLLETHITQRSRFIGSGLKSGNST